MATTYTTNYNLGKQENHADKFDMDVITDNADKIDAALTAKADKSTTYTKTEVDTALSGKQATLTTEQLAAVNSGITSDDVAQITTNKNNISSKAGIVAQQVSNGTITVSLSADTATLITCTTDSNGVGVYLAIKYAAKSKPDIYKIFSSGTFDTYITAAAVASSNQVTFTSSNNSIYMVVEGVKLK